MLFEPARHEPLAADPWNAARAQQAVRDIVADMEATLADGHTWPVHPLDVEDAVAAHHSLYLGASGALWTLWFLAREGACRLRIDPAARITAVHANYLAAPDTGSVVPSYFLGETGVLLLAWRLTGDRAAADRMFAAVEANIPNRTNEALWAAPGTMLAAWHMLQWTGERRWRDLFLANVEHVWALWHPSERAACHLWTQDLNGRAVQLLGAGHGFVGNAYPLLAGTETLSDARRATLLDRCAETLRVTARIEGDAANWPPGMDPPRPGRPALVVQWCHGAPGIVTGLSAFPAGLRPEMDAMLVMAGRTVWAAGPLEKGYGLCHGTAGNGYAFLALHRRTRDAVWLDRARAFAMHAIGQQERMRETHGRGRYSLWTGDPGLAVYLWHCLQGAGGMPGLDVL